MYRNDVACERADLVALFLELHGGNTDTVGVTVEEDAGVLALGSRRGLDPLADTSAVPHGLEEAKRTSVGVRPVVGTHDLLDGLAGLVGVVEGNGAHIVVKDVSLDDAVEDVAANEAELAVNGGSSATSKVP